MRIAAFTPVAVSMLVALPALAQDDVAQPAEIAATETQAEVKPRRWLLREGSLLVQARGAVERAPATGWWQFTLRDEADPRVKQTLGLLPCSLLDEMVRVEESLPGHEVVFEVTGQVYVYRGRNFLLPTIAPQLIEYGPPEEEAATEPPSADLDPSNTDEDSDANESATEAEAASSESNDDSVEDIISDLESSVGALPRSAAANANSGAATAPDGSSSASELVREQTMLLSRRGQVTRTSSGAWLFVFDADAQGLADPPMILMPCLLLEHLEQRVWRSGSNVPVLISGRAYVFDNRNYLLPTAFQIARELTPIAR